MHVRVLLPRLVRHGDSVVKAAALVRHVSPDPVERSARVVDRLVRSGRARVPGEREHHESKVVEVGARIEHTAVAPEPADPGAVAKGMPEKKFISVGGSIDAPAKTHEMRARKRKNLPRLDAHPFVRHIGRTR